MPVLRLGRRDDPGTPDTADDDAVEVGVKFARRRRTASSRGVRFYKGAGNTGTHIGTLWTTTGQRLATGTFTNETATGWQTAAVPDAGRGHREHHLRRLVLAPNGHYASDAGYFTRHGAPDCEPLHALATGVDGANGVYRTASTAASRTQTFGDANYWVDVVWADAAAPDTRRRT